MTFGRELHNLFTLHSRLHLSNVYLPVHIQIQSLLVAFPLVLPWRVFGKLGREGTLSNWLLARTWRAQVHVGIWT